MGLTEIVVPDSVTTIECKAFIFCSNLTKISLPASLETIEYDAFRDCTALNAVYYSGTAAEWEGVMGRDQLPTTAVVYFYAEQKPAEAGNYWYYENGAIKIYSYDTV